MTAVLLNIPNATPTISLPTLAMLGVVIILAAYWNQIVEKLAIWRVKKFVVALTTAAVLSTSFVYINDFGWCDGWWAYICLF